MFEVLKKFVWKDMFVGALVFTVIATVVHQVEAMLTMGYYTDPRYAGLWSKVMMPTAGPPPLSFFITSLIISYLTGWFVVGVYQIIKSEFGKGYWTKAVNAAGLFWKAGVIFFLLPLYLMFNVPLLLLVWWAVSSAIIFMLMGMYLARK